MNDEQLDFLEKLSLRIPRLFDVIRQGNIKSEYIIGIRRIGQRQVRLKMVAEVVDPGANPLASHSTLRGVNRTDQAVITGDVIKSGQAVVVAEPANHGEVIPAAKRRRSRKR